MEQSGRWTTTALGSSPGGSVLREHRLSGEFDVNASSAAGGSMSVAANRAGEFVVVVGAVSARPRRGARVRPAVRRRWISRRGDQFGGAVVERGRAGRTCSDRRRRPSIAAGEFVVAWLSVCRPDGEATVAHCEAGRHFCPVRRDRVRCPEFVDEHVPILLSRPRPPPLAALTGRSWSAVEPMPDTTCRRPRSVIRCGRSLNRFTSFAASTASGSSRDGVDADRPRPPTYRHRIRHRARCHLPTLFT